MRRPNTHVEKMDLRFAFSGRSLLRCPHAEILEGERPRDGPEFALLLPLLRGQHEQRPGVPPATRERSRVTLDLTPRNSFR